MSTDDAAGSAPLPPHGTFDRELGELEHAVVEMAQEAEGLVRYAGQVAGGATPADAAEAHRADDVIDRAFLAVAERVVLLIARRQPVAGDLRRILALNQASLHLERIADGAVDVVAFVDAAGAPPEGSAASTLARMAATTVEMTATALQALTATNTEAALTVEALDDELDQLLALATTTEGTDGVPLLVDRCARALARCGGHAVDIAEVSWFAATGELRELSRPPEALRSR